MTEEGLPTACKMKSSGKVGRVRRRRTRKHVMLGGGHCSAVCDSLGSSKLVGSTPERFSGDMVHEAAAQQFST